MGKQHLLRRPCENALQRLASCSPVGKGYPKLAWHRRFAGDHKIQPGNKRAPSREPARFKMLY